MKIIARLLKILKKAFGEHFVPEHIKVGREGEQAAKKYLISKGLKFLTANFNSGRGEIDLIFRDNDCLVFVEVKTRNAGGWTRPEKAVDYRKRKALLRAAFDYIRLLKNPHVKFRFDIVEVISVDHSIREIRHIPNAFNSEKQRRYYR